MVSGNWKPPSEDEFNKKWVEPLDALDVSDIRMADDHEIWALTEQLKAGQIIAVARTAQRSSAWLMEDFALVFPGAWRRMNDSDEDYFWKTGHLVVAKLNAIGMPDADKERYFNIRFDPASFSGKPPPKLPDERDHRAIGPKEVPVRGKDISIDDAKRISVAILAGWPDATEVFAHTKALAFFPQNKVPRDWFLSIFRSIRGEKKRGRKPKNRE